MRIVLVTLGLVGLVVAPGCKKEKKADPDQTAEKAPGGEAPAGETPAAGEAPAGEGGGGEAGTGGGGGGGEGEKRTMANKMAHCPSAVPGAKTDVVEDNGKVVITVTAEGDAKVAEIQKRAEHLDKVDSAPDDEVKHTGMGTGGGRGGKCPVVMSDVTLEVAKQKDGVKVTLTPKEGASAGEIVLKARERATAIASGGVGVDDEDAADPEK